MGEGLGHQVVNEHEAAMQIEFLIREHEFRSEVKGDPGEYISTNPDLFPSHGMKTIKGGIDGESHDIVGVHPQADIRAWMKPRNGDRSKTPGRVEFSGLRGFFNRMLNVTNRTMARVNDMYRKETGKSLPLWPAYEKALNKINQINNAYEKNIRDLVTIFDVADMPITTDLAQRLHKFFDGRNRRLHHVQLNIGENALQKSKQDTTGMSYHERLGLVLSIGKQIMQERNYESHYFREFARKNGFNTASERAVLKRLDEWFAERRSEFGTDEAHEILGYYPQSEMATFGITSKASHSNGLYRDFRLSSAQDRATPSFADVNSNKNRSQQYEQAIIDEYNLNIHVTYKGEPMESQHGR